MRSGVLCSFIALAVGCAPRASMCTTSAGCDDGVACTTDVCVASACTHRTDSSACAVGEVCEPGGCVPGRACATDTDCSDADPCTAGERCVPATRTCTFDTLDGDGDGDPPAVCGGTDCDDTRGTVSGGAPEICDGLDNDCDGANDAPLVAPIATCDGACVDTASDEANCGSCGHACDASERCEASACVVQHGAVLAELSITLRRFDSAPPLLLRGPDDTVVLVAGDVTAIGTETLAAPSLVVLRLDVELRQEARGVFGCLDVSCQTHFEWVDVDETGAVTLLGGAREVLDFMGPLSPGGYVMRLGPALAPVSATLDGPEVRTLLLHDVDGVEQSAGVLFAASHTLCGQSFVATETEFWVCRGAELLRRPATGDDGPVLDEASPGGPGIAVSPFRGIVTWGPGFYWDDPAPRDGVTAVGLGADSRALLGVFATDIAMGADWGPITADPEGDAIVLAFADADLAATPSVLHLERSGDQAITHVTGAGSNAVAAIIWDVDHPLLYVWTNEPEPWIVDETGYAPDGVVGLSETVAVLRQGDEVATWWLESRAL